MNEKLTPSSLFISQKGVAEESTSTIFRYYSEFGPNLLHHLRIEFPVVKC